MQKFFIKFRGIETFCSIYVWFISSVYILIVPATWYITIAELKSKVFWIVSITFVLFSALLGLELFLVSMGEKKPARKRSPTKIKIISALLVMYLGFTGLSALVSPFSGTFLGNGRYDGVLTIGLYVLSTLILIRYFKPGKWLLLGFGGVVSIVCVIGIAQFMGFNPFYLYPGDYNFYDAGIYYADQFWSTIGNTNLCAAFLSVSSAVFAATAIRCDGAVRKWSFIPLFLSIFSIVELNAEAGLVALMVGLLVMLPFVVINERQIFRSVMVWGVAVLACVAASALEFYDGGVTLRWGAGAGAIFVIGLLLWILGWNLDKKFSTLHCLPRNRMRLALVCFVLAVLCGALVILYLYDRFPYGFLRQAHEILRGNLDDNFGSGRIYIWRQVWELVKEAPLLGGGPDTLGLRGLIPFSRFNEELEIEIVGTIDAAHNEYLNILVNQGLLSLLPYLAALILTFIKWWKDAENIAVAICGCAMFFYSIQAFFGISMCIIAPYLWVAIAIVNINCTTERGESHEKNAKTFSNQSCNTHAPSTVSRIRICRR